MYNFFRVMLTQVGVGENWFAKANQQQHSQPTGAIEPEFFATHNIELTANV
jgi:hypothetical protein